MCHFFNYSNHGEKDSIYFVQSLNYYSYVTD